VRDVADGDMQSIQEIYADQVLHGVSSWEEQPPTLNEMIERRDAIVAAGNPYYVALLDGVVVGYTYASPYRTRVGYRYTIENAIYVAKNTRGHGIGRCLIEALAERCEALGYRQMIAVIGDSENQLSIGFHRQMGFIQVGHIKSIGFKFDRWMDSIVMQRPLGSGDSNLP
jgi:L-amino acid N-acyltransferase YncA